MWFLQEARGVTSQQTPFFFVELELYTDNFVGKKSKRTYIWG
jgi:hypothetical protein